MFLGSLFGWDSTISCNISVRERSSLCPLSVCDLYNWINWIMALSLFMSYTRSTALGYNYNLRDLGLYSGQHALRTTVCAIHRMQVIDDYVLKLFLQQRKHRRRSSRAYCKFYTLECNTCFSISECNETNLDCYNLESGFLK